MLVDVGKYHKLILFTFVSESHARISPRVMDMNGIIQSLWELYSVTESQRESLGVNENAANTKSLPVT